MCCGPVSITPPRLVKIREHLRTMPAAERKRLAKQKRDELDCGFVDKNTYRCTIYPVRPWVCEAFGRTEGLVCPKLGRLVQILPAILVDTGAEKELQSGVVGISNCWDWRKMDFV
jgi:hypothetical protein